MFAFVVGSVFISPPCLRGYTYRVCRVFHCRRASLESQVWGGAAACHLHRIQKLINFAARIVTGAKKIDHITPILENLNWPKIEDIVKHRGQIKISKALN